MYNSESQLKKEESGGLQGHAPEGPSGVPRGMTFWVMTLCVPSWGRVLRNTEMLESKRISSHTVELLLPADPLDAKSKVRIQARP